jgi:hypothetical protein
VPVCAQVEGVFGRITCKVPLVGIRDKDSVAKLSAEEQAACKQLWVNVEMLLRKAEAKK